MRCKFGQVGGRAGIWEDFLEKRAIKSRKDLVGERDGLDGNKDVSDSRVGALRRGKERPFWEGEVEK